MNAIEFRKVSRRFEDFYAIRDLSFEVKKATIHGLIGENGAGKSTAMKALFGIYPPNSGEIWVNGNKVNLKNPIQAMRAGIGMVHQHFMLASTKTVLDNIIIGREPAFAFTFIKRDKARAELTKISERYGLKFNQWDKPISLLSVGEQQQVEILKLLYQHSDILILDEPTAVLIPQEVKELFQNLRRLKEEGKTIILISHKLKEVLEFTDNVTVMRRGEGIGTHLTTETTEDSLAQMMVGRAVSFTYQGPRKMISNSGDLKPVLEVKELSTTSVHESLRKVSFQLKPGEILGIAGVHGNGQSELLHYLSNPKKFKVTAGDVYFIKGREVSDANPLEIRDHGVGLVPEDRLTSGLLLHQSMTENFLLGQHTDPRYQRNGILLRLNAREALEKKVLEFDIRPVNTSTIVGRMSGGNQQKLVIARALDAKPEILLIAHPTRGVDVGAIEKIHESIVHERNAGRAILLFSSELDELIDLSDRILVFFNGEIRAEFSRREFDSWAIGRVMGGGEK